MQIMILTNYDSAYILIYRINLTITGWKMADNSQDFELNETDVAILREVQEDGRISNVELASRIDLSPPATHARLKRLQSQGYIRQYVAILDQEKMGFDMTCFEGLFELEP